MTLDVDGGKMKKILILSLIAMFLVLAIVPVMADTLIVPVDDSIYENPQGILPNSNPDTEELFLETILGLTYNDPSVDFIHKEENYFATEEFKSLTNYDPGFAWLYAVVKVDGKNDGWYAYQNDGINGLSVPTVGQYRYGISHVSFFGSTPVPEPATLILLGLGLLGIAGIRRKK